MITVNAEEKRGIQIIIEQITYKDKSAPIYK